MRILLFALLIAVTPTIAQAGLLSKQEVSVTQLKIVTSNGVAAPLKRTAWGIESNYIGPGDIRRLQRIDIYLDDEHRISFVKVTRTTYTNDTATLLFSQVQELSIQTLAATGSTRPHQRLTIAIHTADSFTFP